MPSWLLLTSVAATAVEEIAPNLESAPSLTNHVAVVAASAQAPTSEGAPIPAAVMASRVVVVASSVDPHLSSTGAADANEHNLFSS